MKTRWQQLELRQKRWLALSVITLLILILFEITLNPLIKKNAELRSTLTQDQALLAWMKAADRHMQHITITSLKTSSTNAIEMMGFLQKSLKSSELDSYLTQFAQGENHTVQLTFSKVNFDHLVRWLIEIESKHQVHVAQTSITPNGPIETVDAIINLKGDP